MTDEGQSPYQKFILNDNEPPEPETKTVDDPGQHRQQIAPDASIQRLSRRLTLLAVLIPCLAMTAVLAAYLDLKNRDEVLRQTLAAESLQAWQGLEMQLNDLSARYQQVENSMKEKFPSINQTADTLKADSRQVRQTIRELSDLKADKKELAQSKKQAEQTFAEIRNALKQFHDESASGDQKLSQSIAGLKASIPEGITTTLTELKAGIGELGKNLETTRTALKQTQASLKTGLSRKMNKKELDGTLTTCRQAFRQELNALLKKMINDEKRLAAAEEKLTTIERRLKTDFSRQTIPPLRSSNPGNVNKDAIIEKSLSE